jgi:hypothetical protein
MLCSVKDKAERKEMEDEMVRAAKAKALERKQREEASTPLLLRQGVAMAGQKVDRTPLRGAARQKTPLRTPKRWGL